MGDFSEYGEYDGTGLAELIRNKSISPTELCEAAITQAEKLNPKLNVIVTPLYDYARNSAEKTEPGAVFSGVPFLLKDVHHALKGFPMSYGSKALKGVISDYDAEIVRRFKNAGLIIFGKTNTPEFKLSYVTEPEAFGPARNPWNPEYSPGGSSGGSAAAVAARIVPFASGTDEGGSIRVPASYCGLFGLKPSRGRNPVGPDLGDHWDGMSTSHVITRSVRDSAAMLDSISGPEAGGRWNPAGPGGPFAEAIQSDPGPLKIGYYTRAAFGIDVHAECVKAVEKTCSLLESLGHGVENIAPGFSEEDAAFDWVMVMIGHLAAHIENLSQVHGRKYMEQNIELSSYALCRLGQRIRALDFVKAGRRWLQYSVRMDKTLRQYDMLLSPTLGRPPIAVGSQEPSKKDRRAMKFLASPAGKIITGSSKLTRSVLGELVQNTMQGQMPFTMIANITGLPSMSVPLHWTGDGLPCGVQFTGRFGDETTLLKLAAQLEKAQPWADRKPAMIQ